MSGTEAMGRPAPPESGFGFAITARDPGGARRGRLRTDHGEIETPVFMPVGTVGSVKAMTFDALRAAGFRLVLGNTYHLYLRPGHRLVEELGGLHRFQGWEGALLTDSAGYQVFSFAERSRVDDDGVTFRSHLDGSLHRFTPELSIEVQLALGADICMAFDHCLPHGVEPAAVRAAVDRTTAWARRCRDAFGGGGRTRRGGWERVLFGIVQGGLLPAERRRSAAQLLELDLPGYAVGGLCLGESQAAMLETAALTAELLPAERPRYLMGVGFPDDLVEAVGSGLDMFDCVLPTRMGRTATAICRDGRLALGRQELARDERPLDPDCRCPVCLRHSRAYLRHLWQAREMLAPILTTTHNLHLYAELMRGCREAIAAGRFAAFAAEVGERWRRGEGERRREIAARRRP